MKQKDLLLVGGGFIAGYVICKMMNRNASMESFSADGTDRAFAGQQFKWVGGAKPRIQGQMGYRETMPSATFQLTGKMVKLKPHGGLLYDINDLYSSTTDVTQGKVKDYYETNITKTIQDLPITPNGRTLYTRKVYVTLDSIKKV
jgi:hypothetical protein